MADHAEVEKLACAPEARLERTGLWLCLVAEALAEGYTAATWKLTEVKARDLATLCGEEHGSEALGHRSRRIRRARGPRGRFGQ